MDEGTWQAQVDAVERAQQTGDPVLLDSSLKEFEDFVQSRLPVEVVAGDASRSFAPQVEQLRRELATVSDPVARESLQRNLEFRRQEQQSLQRLARSDEEWDAARRRTIAQELSARTPEEADRARAQLRALEQERDLQQASDKARASTIPAEEEQRLDALREWLLPAGDARREQLIQQAANAGTPEEELQARQQRDEYVDRQTLQQQQRLTEKLHTVLDTETRAADEDLLRRIDGLHGGTPQDPQEAALRQQLGAATNPQDRSRIIQELGAHQQQVLQQRVDAATTPQERQHAFDAQAKLNNWTPLERRLADLRGTNLGGVPEADPQRAELIRQAENARTPEEGLRARQQLVEYDNRQAPELTRRWEEVVSRQGGFDTGPDTAATHADLMRQFEEVRRDDSHLDPREAELNQQREAATTPRTRGSRISASRTTSPAGISSARSPSSSGWSRSVTTSTRSPSCVTNSCGSAGRGLRRRSYSRPSGSWSRHSRTWPRRGPRTRRPPRCATNSGSRSTDRRPAWTVPARAVGERGPTVRAPGADWTGWSRRASTRAPGSNWSTRRRSCGSSSRIPTTSARPSTGRTSPPRTRSMTVRSRSPRKSSTTCPSLPAGPMTSACPTCRAMSWSSRVCRCPTRWLGRPRPEMRGHRTLR